MGERQYVRFEFSRTYDLPFFPEDGSSRFLWFVRPCQLDMCLPDHTECLRLDTQHRERLICALQATVRGTLHSFHFVKLLYLWRIAVLLDVTPCSVACEECAAFSSSLQENGHGFPRSRNKTVVSSCSTRLRIVWNKVADTELGHSRENRGNVAYWRGCEGVVPVFFIDPHSRFSPVRRRLG